jgi:hypothetical protein
MTDYVIRVRGRPRIRINDGGWQGVPAKKGGKGKVATRNRSRISTSSPTGSLAIGFEMIEKLEIRVEAVFRPAQKDVEVSYVLSGAQRDTPDMLHTLAADFIVSHADERSLKIMFAKVIDAVLLERAGKTGLFVQVHSHPAGGIPEPSEADQNTWLNVSSDLSAAFPGANILFGVHGVGSKQPDFIERTRPSNISPNTLFWSSNTREHALGFFSASSKPQKVSYVG